MENIDSIKHTFVSYLEEIFQTSYPVEMEDVVEVLEPKVTETMNRNLGLPVTVEEIKSAAFQIGAWKAPGPDGINGLFFQSYWHIVEP